MADKIMATCSSCGTKHEVEVWPRINVKDNPELKAKVKDGSLFVWQCPSCGTKNLAGTQTLYHDPEAKLLILLLPESPETEPLVKALESQMEQPESKLEGYTLRRACDIGTLIEKVNIFDSGLDDTVIEMCKYVTKMELTEKNDSKEIMDAPFKFYKLNGADNDIILTYPANGEIKAINIGFNVYEDCSGIIRRNPSVKPENGFAKVDPAFILKFFR